MATDLRGNKMKWKFWEKESSGGSGDDGTLHIGEGVEVIIRRDTDFKKLVIDEGGSLNPNGFRIRCQDSDIRGNIVGHKYGARLDAT